MQVATSLAQALMKHVEHSVLAVPELHSIAHSVAHEPPHTHVSSAVKAVSEGPQQIESGLVGVVPSSVAHLPQPGALLHVKPVYVPLPVVVPWVKPVAVLVPWVKPVVVPWVKPVVVVPWVKPVVVPWVKPVVVPLP